MFVLGTPHTTHNTHTTQAAEDARRQMGNRVFYDQMYRDVCHQQVLGVTDEVDVTTMKEYMQVCVPPYVWTLTEC